MGTIGLEITDGVALLTVDADRSFRTETGPPGLAWDAAVEFERTTQMWSQRRRADRETS
jgi:enoyl-CoA hydratase